MLQSRISGYRPRHAIAGAGAGAGAGVGDGRPGAVPRLHGGILHRLEPERGLHLGR